MRDLNERRELAARGIAFLDTAMYAQDAWMTNLGLAMDAQPQLVTTSSAGIPAFLTNMVDPQVVRVLTQPTRISQIIGETQKGSWTDLSMQFPIVENSGSIAAYGDYSNNGNTDVNANFVARQSYNFQTILRWGERHAAFMGLAAISEKAELDISAAQQFVKWLNRYGFFGVTGLTNYGLLNDPALIAPSTPAVKAAGGTSWTGATAQEIYTDVLTLFGQLLAQMGYNIDMATPMTLVLSPLKMVQLLKVSQFNVTARATIDAAFPNLTIISAPEYTTAGGELMQLILKTYDGVQTAYTAYNSKMRTHALVQDVSSWKQKVSAGTWGTIIRRPIAIAQMIGL